MASKLGNGKLRKDQTDHYGRIKRGGGGGGATVDDFVDTSTIKVSEDTQSGKVRMDVASDVVTKIENSLQTPLQTPTATELVGIDTTKSQKRISIGDGLQIVDDELVATGGSGDNKLFVVTLLVDEGDDEVEYTSDKTFLEIINAIDDGKIPIMMAYDTDGEFISMFSIRDAHEYGGSGYIQFSNNFPDMANYIEIRSDGQIGSDDEIFSYDWFYTSDSIWSYEISDAETIAQFAFSHGTKEDYNNLSSKDENTFYIVKGDDYFELYLGELPLHIPTTNERKES